MVSSHHFEVRCWFRPNPGQLRDFSSASRAHVYRSAFVSLHPAPQNTPVRKPDQHEVPQARSFRRRSRSRLGYRIQPGIRCADRAVRPCGSEGSAGNTNGAGFNYAKKTANKSVSSSATLQADDNLTIAVGANGSWGIRSADFRDEWWWQFQGVPICSNRIEDPLGSDAGEQRFDPPGRDLWLGRSVLHVLDRTAKELHPSRQDVMPADRPTA